jgi:hypothetical protein
MTEPPALVVLNIRNSGNVVYMRTGLETQEAIRADKEK